MKNIKQHKFPIMHPLSSAPSRAALDPVLFEKHVRLALEEDLGQAGDITSDSIFNAEQASFASIGARKSGVIAGLDVMKKVFEIIDPDVTIELQCQDGEKIEPGQKLALLRGATRSILRGERVALNYMGHLSGIATLTSQLVECVSHTKARVTCTRKTLPGLRYLEKYAVRMGGGFNHRFGLFDAVLIKDNHIAACGGDIQHAVSLCREKLGHMVKIGVEADRLDQIEDIIAAGADSILLDNMNNTDLRRAVKTINGRIVTEASGGVRLENIGAIAESGVDYISCGFITHSAPNLDLGLDF